MDAAIGISSPTWTCHSTLVFSDVLSPHIHAHTDTHQHTHKKQSFWQLLAT